MSEPDAPPRRRPPKKLQVKAVTDRLSGWEWPPRVYGNHDKDLAYAAYSVIEAPREEYPAAARMPNNQYGIVLAPELHLILGSLRTNAYSNTAGMRLWLYGAYASRPVRFGTNGWNYAAILSGVKELVNTHADACAAALVEDAKKARQREELAAFLKTVPADSEHRITTDLTYTGEWSMRVIAPPNVIRKAHKLLADFLASAQE